MGEKMMKKQAFLILGLLSVSTLIPFGNHLEASSSEIRGKLGNYSAYFLDEHKLRHQRLELSVTQKAKIGYRITTVFEGRGRMDFAIFDDKFAPYSDIDPRVRADEMSEFESRQLYFGYIGDSFTLSVGQQRIDWVESLSTNSNEMMTPLDLRHGGFGNSADVIVPVTAIKFNHKLFDTSIEWLLMPFANHSRLPQGNNRYGFYQYLEDRAGRYEIALSEQKPDKNINQAEIGTRILGNYGHLQWTLFAMRAHQRTPVIENSLDESKRIANTTMTYPLLNTYGLFMNLSDDSYVLRLNVIMQPKRRPALLDIFEDEVNDVYHERFKLGLGYDYVFNKHFKIYSDHFIQRTFKTGNVDYFAKNEEMAVSDFSHNIRFTNESLPDVVFNLDISLMWPEEAQVYYPNVTVNFWDHYEAELGLRRIISKDEESKLEILKNSSHLYASLFYYFGLSD
jgi:hypothetical protein